MKPTNVKRQALYVLVVLILCASQVTGFSALAASGDSIAYGGINYKIISEIGNAGMVEVAQNPNASGDIVIPKYDRFTLEC